MIFRQSRENRYTLPVLLGCLEKEGVGRHFQIVVAPTMQEAAAQGTREAIIAFSFMTPHVDTVCREVEKLRGIFKKNSLFLAGGSHPSGDPAGTLELGFDFVFIGEAERTFPRFLREFLDGKNPREKLIRDQNRPSRLLDHPSFSFEHGFFAPIEITRGCYYNCAFCQTPSLFGHPPRHRTPESVAETLKQARAFGYRQSKFVSPNAFSYGSKAVGNPDLEKIERFLLACREAGTQGIHFGCYPSEVRPDWVNPDVLELLRKYSWNKTVVLGAQSGSDSLLSRIRRGHTVRQAAVAVEWIRKAGFRPHVDFVFGFPGETLEDRQSSIRMIGEIIERWEGRIHAHTFLPLPGTPLFREDPTPLDGETKNSLLGWEKRNKLDGWWKEQEIIAWKIIEWRDRGIVRG